MRLLSSLSNRIFFASAMLTVVCMGTAAWLVNARVRESADLELGRELAQAGAAVAEQRQISSELIAQIARVVADLPKLKAAVATDDPPTVEPVAAEYRAQVGSDLFLVTNRAGRVLASVASPGAVEDDIGALVSVRDALAGHEGRMLRLHPAGALQIVSHPITVGIAPAEVLGTLSVGFLLDDALAQRMKALTGSEVAFTAGPRVLASSLPLHLRPAVGAFLRSRGSSSVWVGDDEYLVQVQPLALPAAPAPGRPEGAAAIGGGGPGDPMAPLVVILRSRTDRLRFLRPIQTALGLTALGFVLAATLLSYAIARTVTRPLAAITAAMREMTATGDLAQQITWPSRRWDDEDARLLARTFNALTESVARFQREAAERDRLSALGRMSSVIAHEVRNPLMIIKASLRPLTAGSPTPSEVREAVSDIDEEVGRLNRLVDDVLDFARLMRFDVGPADVNRICEESASAATAGCAEPPVHLALDPSRPVIVTDAERLRSALVNLLANARQAVDARTAAGDPASGGTDRAWSPAATPADNSGPEAAAQAEPAVELTTTARPGGSVTIVVRDRGIGIDAADLPKVFEPYFTTRRGGTGLGLAISRNIVEGLGGTISLTSQPGVGTEVRIELPGRPAEAEG